MVILFLFIAGFTLHVTSIFKPAYRAATDVSFFRVFFFQNLTFQEELSVMRMSNPGETLEMLFFSLFGLVEPDAMPPLHLVPYFAK